MARSLMVATEEKGQVCYVLLCFTLLLITQMEPMKVLNVSKDLHVSRNSPHLSTSV